MKTNPRQSEAFLKLLAHRETVRVRAMYRMLAARRHSVVVCRRPAGYSASQSAATPFLNLADICLGR